VMSECSVGSLLELAVSTRASRRSSISNRTVHGTPFSHTHSTTYTTLLELTDSIRTNRTVVGGGLDGS